MNTAPPERFNLAAVRIFFFICVLWTVSGPDYFLQWAKVPPQFWHPRGILRLFSEPISADIIVFCFHAWRWLTIACLFGFLYRWIAPLWWLLGLIVMTNGHSYGYQGHVYMPVVLAGLPLCFSRASDALSFDSWKKNVLFDRRIASVHSAASNDANRPCTCVLCRWSFEASLWGT